MNDALIYNFSTSEYSIPLRAAASSFVSRKVILSQRIGVVFDALRSK